MRDFKELKVWQKSHSLTMAVYKATKTFPKEEMRLDKPDSTSVFFNFSQYNGRLRKRRRSSTCPFSPDSNGFGKLAGTLSNAFL